MLVVVLKFEVVTQVLADVGYFQKAVKEFLQFQQLSVPFIFVERDYWNSVAFLEDVAVRGIVDQNHTIQVTVS